MAKNQQKGKAKAAGSSKNEDETVIDPLAEALGPNPIEQFVEENKVLLLGAFVAVIAVVAAVLFFKDAKNATMEEAAQAYAEAKSIDELEEVMKAYPGSIVEGNAMLRKAAILDDDDKTEDAQSVLLDFRDRFPKHPRYFQAIAILGRIAESNGELESAGSFYTEIPKESDLYPYAQIHLGDILMQEKKFTDAKEVYEPIIVDANFAATAWRSALDDRSSRVERNIKLQENPAKDLKLPEPAKTEEPAGADAPANAPETQGANEAGSSEPSVTPEDAEAPAAPENASTPKGKGKAND